MNFDFPSITDPPTYDMVSAIVFVSLGLDCVAYLCFAVLMYLTYTPTRTPHGGSRKVGPKMNP